MIKAKLLAGCGGLPKDAYFRNVTLLLHGDGSNGAQNNTFLDSSSNNFTITRNGNTTQGSFSPYGSLWSNYFDGSGDYITSPDNAAVQFGSGDFTIELWLNFSSSSGVQCPLVSRANTGVFAPYQLYLDTGSLKLYGSTNGSSWNIFNGLNVIPSVSVGTWYHVVLVRSGSNFSTYLNGARQANATVSGSLLASSAPVTIGSDAGGANPYNGYISNLRMAKGVAVYDPSQSTITVPTTPLTAISGTSLLTCQSNRFRDASSNNFAITRNGDVRVTPFSPYAPTAPYSAAANGGSIYFDGSGDRLALPNDAAFQYGTGDFTVEAWIYMTSLSPSSSPVMATSGNTGGAGGTHTGVMSNGNIEFFDYVATTRVANGGTITTNQWFHIAVTRSGTTLRIFQNGSQVASGTCSSNFTGSASGGGIGSWVTNDTGLFFNGYISNLRAVKGTAVYTSNFTPPTAPVTAITNTSLLLNGTNAAIFDNAMQNDLETVGNAQISTSVKKFGTGSIFINGSGNYLTAPNSDLYAFGTGDFTVECWFKSSVSSQNTHATMLGCYQSSVNGTWALKVYNNVAAFASFSNNTWYDWNTSTNVVADQQWHHIAATRSGTTLRVFVDGVVAGTWSSVTNNLTTAGHPLTVGWMQQDTASPLQGYLDDIRITKGVARYTANFTPPTAAFANQ